MTVNALSTKEGWMFAILLDSVYFKIETKILY